MATRFWLPSIDPDAVAAVSPALHSGWQPTPAGFVRRRMVTTKIGSPLLPVTVTLGATPHDYCVRQFVSDPINAATIAGTIKCYVQTKTNSTSNWPQLSAQVVSNNGLTQRGVLLVPTSAPTAGSLIMVNRQYHTGAGTALSSVVASQDDRIVVEIGIIRAGGSGNSTVECQVYGDDSATDLPENETDLDASTKNPWVEFSDTITFNGGAPGIPPAGGLKTIVMASPGEKKKVVMA